MGELFEELQDGFQNGEDDVLEFVKSNLVALNKKSCPPGMEFMIDMKTQQ